MVVKMNNKSEKFYEYMNATDRLINDYLPYIDNKQDSIVAQNSFVL